MQTKIVSSVAYYHNFSIDFMFYKLFRHTFLINPFFFKNGLYLLIDLKDKEMMTVSNNETSPNKTIH